MADSTTNGMLVSISTHVRPLSAIAMGGAVVGVLDIVYAILVYSPGKPILILQYIASGILGSKSFSGGVYTATLGLLLHFTIAFSAAAVYYLASRRAGFLLDHAVISGLVYGALVYIFMHEIVLPLSAVSPSGMPTMNKVYEFIEHWFCVGLPIALSVRHFSR